MQNTAGNPVADILIVGERDDGAESVSSSGIDGKFTLPVGEGIWEIYTLVLDPRTESDRISVTITNESPESIVLSTPWY